MARVNTIQGEAVAWREVDGEFVLISVETTHYYSLNSTGSDVWRVLLEGPQTASSIAAALALRHGMEAKAVEPEVSVLLAELESEGLIHAEELELPTGAAQIVALHGNGAGGGNGGYQSPSLAKYEALERLMLSGE